MSGKDILCLPVELGKSFVDGRDCLQKPLWMECHALNGFLDIFDIFTSFSEIPNFNFPTGKNIFPNWIFNISQLAHFRETFFRIKTKDSCRGKYAVFETRISLLFRDNALGRDMYIAGARNTCLHEERCRTARSNPRHYTKHKNNGEGAVPISL